MSRRNVKIIIVIISCIVVVLLGIILPTTIINNHKQAEARSEICRQLVGKTFTGEYYFNGSHYKKRAYFTVYIIDELYCTVHTETYSDSLGREDHWGYDIEKVRYYVDGWEPITFRWGEEGAPVEPFSVTIRNGEFELITSNYSSHTSLRLREVDLNWASCDWCGGKNNLVWRREGWCCKDCLLY